MERNLKQRQATRSNHQSTTSTSFNTANETVSVTLPPFSSLTNAAGVSRILENRPLYENHLRRSPREHSRRRTFPNQNESASAFQSDLISADNTSLNLPLLPPLLTPFQSGTYFRNEIVTEPTVSQSTTLTAPPADTSCTFRSRKTYVAAADGRYYCDWPGCDKSFHRTLNLRAHIQVHKGTPLNIY
jgi:hypothetical protein